MKKLLLLLSLAAFSFSCNQKEVKNSDKQSIGNTNSLAVFIDDKLWIGEIGDTIRKKFAAPVDGLPQEEPLFTINQYPLHAFEGSLAKNRNILYIKKEARNDFNFSENQFGVPQNLIRISGNSTASIIGHLEKNAAEIIARMQQTEIEVTQNQIKASLMDDKKFRNKFNISLLVPKTFKVVLEKDKFLWLKQEIQTGNSSILIYQVPLHSIKKNDDAINNIVRARDSIGGLYIHGTTENSQMITEDSYSPYLINTTIGGLKAFQTKGNWELRNDTMSGPFINYSIIDAKNNRILVIEGFCYAPSTPQRDLMHELESIIKSISFL
ncbi:MAG: DUF4837 domain-containing protein [Flavobacterium sp. 38-13]|uniref:DUF4837 family protein n=1 Tax=Flavobacterium sp. 38-13 TaxID=1896168 RepID=UPI000968BDC4|nr:DUF4837 family protein [Flavobacterium sp. 38-13]OJX52780.1 MAG: DUF4837 domain-containing protein [Flavobacterium sp. 38-13]